jgi:PAS domain-containing protein
VDISERKRTENALRESERKYRELADQLDEALRKKGESRRKIGQILIDNGLATELDIAEGLAEREIPGVIGGGARLGIVRVGDPKIEEASMPEDKK